jgi:hypothetical protein
LITLKTDYLSEQALAEVALAIQNRWNLAAFVKMHEIIVMDDEEADEISSHSTSLSLNATEIEKGIRVIMGKLELDRAFTLERKGKQDFRLKLVDPTLVPKWVERANSNLNQPPEGVFACPHCGKWFSTEFELSMHTKLHYIL